MTARLLLLASALLFSMLIAELGLRVLGISHASIGTVDPVRGWALRPGASAHKSTEGESDVEINADGQRDRLHARQKPPGTFRIAVLGDSFTLASHVAVEQTYWSILESLLEECSGLAGRTPEVINFGVTGYGTAQELLTLRHHVWEYEPDLVLLAFLPGNDFKNNSRALAQDPLAPYMLLENGELVLDDRFRDSREFRNKKWAYNALHYSWLAQVVKQAWVSSQAMLRQGVRPTAEGVFLDYDHRLYREPDTAVWQDAWAVTEAILQQMNREVRERDATLVVTTLSSGLQVYPDRSSREKVYATAGIDDPFYADHRLRAAGDRFGFPVITLAPRMLEHAEREQVYLHGFQNTVMGIGHWNVDGHALVAELAARDLCEILDRP